MQCACHGTAYLMAFNSTWQDIGYRGAMANSPQGETCLGGSGGSEPHALISLDILVLIDTKYKCVAIC
ncbi:hypothetical protein [Tortoise microvirus 86]|nr:hypothetical protein [Tortoise microvirus 86]